MIKTHCNKTLGTKKILIPLKIHVDLLVWVSVTPFSSRGIVPIRTNNWLAFAGLMTGTC